MGCTVAARLAFALATLSGASADADITVLSGSGGNVEAETLRHFGAGHDATADCQGSPDCHITATTNYYEVFVFAPGGSVCGVTNADPIYWTNDITATSTLKSSVSIVGDTLVVNSLGNATSLNKSQMAESPCDSRYIGDTVGNANYVIRFTTTNRLSYALRGSLNTTISSVSSFNGGNASVGVNFYGGSDPPVYFYTNAVQTTINTPQETQIFEAGELGPGSYTLLVGANAGVRWSNPSTYGASWSVSLRLGPEQVRLRALEVNQVIQDWSNSVPLIAGKPTFVRAFVMPVDPNDTGLSFTGQLRGFRAGVELPGSPLHLVNPGGYGSLDSDPANDQSRAELGADGNSANFQLPPSWVDGPVTLKFETPDLTLICGEPAEPNGAPNDCTVSVDFLPSPRMPIKFLRVGFIEPTTGLFSQPSEYKVDQMVTLLPEYLPVKDIDYTVGATLIPVEYIANTDRLLEALRFLREDEELMSPDVLYFYYGCFSGPLTATNGSVAIDGVADSIPGQVACGILGTPLERSASVTAHELGHLFGRYHAVDHLLPQVNGFWQGYCGEKAGLNAPNFPYFYLTDGNGFMPALGPMLLGPDALVYGITPDPSPFSVQSPFASADLMGYCEPTFIRPSKFTYEGILADLALLPLGAAPPVVRALPIPADGPLPDGGGMGYLLVRAFVALDTDQVTWLPFRTVLLSNSPPLPPAGEYTLELLDDTDAVVTNVSFALSVPEDSSAQESGFSFLLPMTPTVHQARLKKNGVVLGVRGASASEPTAHLLSPTGGEKLTNDTVPATWDGSDADGDPLAFNVMYSPDGGLSWSMLGMNLQTNALSVLRSSLQASTNGLIRISVSDGFWSTEDTSAPFTVANNGPRISIISPTSGTAFMLQQPIIFRAAAYDPDEGSGLTNIAWSSSLDGPLGAGPTLTSSADSLSQGVHLITATVTDDSGASATNSITILIVSPPMIAVQPLSFTNDPGTTASFSVSATGTAPLNYQWTRNGASLSDGGSISGATGTNLLVSGVGESDQGAYQVVVTNFYGRTTSSVATLSVNLPPSITAQPQSEVAGSIASFTVQAGGTAPLSYQWFKEGVPLADGPRVTGAASPTLALSRVQLADAGTYSVIVSNRFGVAPSDPATLDVISIVQQAYAKASNTGEYDEFGYAVAISGDTMVIGAHYEASSASGVNGDQEDDSIFGAGAVYVFVRNGAAWTQQAYLKASNPDGDDEFGFSVGIAGDAVVVGALYESSDAIGVNGDGGNNNADSAGAAYVFVRNGTNWSQQAYLKASNTGASDHFGCSVAISGDTVVVGASDESSSATGVNGDGANNGAFHSGAAYVFVRSGTNWSQQAYLKASNTGGNDEFGSAVAVAGDTAIVGAYQEDSSAAGINGDGSNNDATDSGAAYVFVRNGATWTQQAYLKASNPGQLDYFGYSLAVAGDTALVGAYREASSATGLNGDQGDNNADYSGAAYVFVRDGTNWAQQAYLKASNNRGGFEFGYAVALADDLAVVGAPYEDSGATGVSGDGADTSASNSGAAYLFLRQGTNWSQPTYLKASNTGVDDNFGWSVATSGGSVVVGAFEEASSATGVNGNQNDNGTSDSGAAYVFSRSFAPTFDSAAWRNDQFQARVLGDFSHRYAVQASTDLFNWASLETNAAPFMFIETNGGGSPVRFFRAVLVP